jgi:hypothetical protein
MILFLSLSLSVGTPNSIDERIAAIFRTWPRSILTCFQRIHLIASPSLIKTIISFQAIFRAQKKVVITTTRRDRRFPRKAPLFALAGRSAQQPVCHFGHCQLRTRPVTPVRQLNEESDSTGRISVLHCPPSAFQVQLPAARYIAFSLSDHTTSWLLNADMLDSGRFFRLGPRLGSGFACKGRGHCGESPVCVLLLMWC